MSGIVLSILFAIIFVAALGALRHAWWMCQQPVVQKVVVQSAIGYVLATALLLAGSIVESKEIGVPAGFNVTLAVAFVYVSVWVPTWLISWVRTNRPAY